MTDRHTTREVTIFNVFANVCSLPIKIDTIKKMAPPAPDIQCEVEGIGMIAFELVEMIDRNHANAFRKQLDTIQQLYDCHNNLPSAARKQFDKLYSNAMIYPDFDNKCTLRRRKRLIPKIIAHIVTLDPGFEGETSVNVRGCRIHVNISRGLSGGPFFDSVPAVSVSDPILSALTLKFQKKYTSRYPIHLLGYLDLSPTFPENTWRPRAEEYCKASIQKSPFERVWIFEYRENRIIFTYP